MDSSKAKKLETIWDHDVTPDEIAGLFFAPWTREEYLVEVASAGDQDGEFGIIYRLYWMRGDMKRAEQYLAKIQNEQYRRDLSVSDIIPPDSEE